MSDGLTPTRHIYRNIGGYENIKNYIIRDEEYQYQLLVSQGHLW